MNKKLLEQIESIRIEKKDLEERIKKLDNMKIPEVTDSVEGSNRNYPYVKRNFTITGFNNIVYSRNKKNKKKYKKLIKENDYTLEKYLNELEYELKKIEDSEIRQIIRHKYEDDMNYIQIAHEMNKNKTNKSYTADSVRMQLKRFVLFGYNMLK